MRCCAHTQTERRTHTTVKHTKKPVIPFSEIVNRFSTNAVTHDFNQVTRKLDVPAYKYNCSCMHFDCIFQQTKKHKLVNVYLIIYILNVKARFLFSTPLLRTPSHPIHQSLHKLCSGNVIQNLQTGCLSPLPSSLESCLPGPLLVILSLYLSLPLSLIIPFRLHSTSFHPVTQRDDPNSSHSPTYTMNNEYARP